MFRYRLLSVYFFSSFLKGLNARMHTNDLSTLWSEESSKKKISDNNKCVFNKDVFHTLIPKWRYIYNRSFIIETGARYLFIFCWPEFYFVWRIIITRNVIQYFKLRVLDLTMGGWFDFTVYYALFFYYN